MKFFKGLSIIFLCLIISYSSGIALVNDYVFTQEIGTYNEINPTTMYWSDDGSYANEASDDNPIGFTFNYNGVDYTTFSICSNGYIRMGSEIGTIYYHGTLRYDDDYFSNVISPLSGELAIYEGFGGSIGSEVTGSEPNRVLTIQWKNISHVYDPYSLCNFQIKLYENDGRIEFIYGPTAINYDDNYDVGIKGNAFADFNSRFINPEENTWASSTASEDPASYYADLTGSFYPNNGLKYSWILPLYNQEYVSSTSTQITGRIPKCISNKEIIRITVVMDGLFNPKSVNSIICNTNGSTNTSDISNAKLYYTGKSSKFDTDMQYGSTIENPGTDLVFTGDQALFNGKNYFWLVYDISCSATYNDVVDGECTSITIEGTSVTPTITAPDGNREIKAPFAGEYTIGEGGDYENFTACFKEINALGLSGNTTLKVISDVYENDTPNLYAWNEVGGSDYTLNIQPDGLGKWNIYGADNGVNFQFWGTHNLTIEGTENKDLSFVSLGDNTYIGITLGNGVTNTVISNINFLGEYQQAIIDYFGENNNMSILDNNFIPDNNYCGGISQNGSIQNVTIDGNYFENCGYGIGIMKFDWDLLNGDNNCDITNNTFTNVNDGIIAYTYYLGINNFRIANNNFSIIECGIFFYGLEPITNTSIVENKVYNSEAESILILSYNTFSDIYINNNEIYNPDSRGIALEIYSESYNNSQNIYVQDNFITSHNHSVLWQSVGIDCILNNVDNAEISGNEIYGLNQESSPYDLIGLEVAGENTNVSVIGNLIHGVSNTCSEGGNAWGLNIIGGSGTLVANNVIYDIKGTDNSLIGLIGNTYGIRIDGGEDHQILYNTVNMFGNLNDVGEDESMSCAFGVISNYSTDLSLINNNFVNTMTGTTDSKSYAIYVPEDYIFNTIDNNNYFTNGENGILGYNGSDVTTLDDWKLYTFQDVNSLAVNPLFTSNEDLRLMQTSPLIASGFPIPEISYDYLNKARNPIATTIGAYENPAVNIPVLLTPENASTNIVIMPTLTWLPYIGAESFRLQISKNARFNPEDIVFEQSGIIGESFNVPKRTLRYDNLYYWRICANVDGVETDYSTAFRFTTMVIPVPTIISPAEMACIDYRQPTFEWSKISGIRRYNFELATDADFTNIIYTNNIRGTSFELPDDNLLEEYSQYYWHVQGVQGNNVGEWSETSMFSVSYFPDGPLTLNLTDKWVCKGTQIELGSMYECGRGIICNTVTGGSGRYRIRWTPTSGLRNANTANPTLVSANTTKTYTIIVTDLETYETIQGNVVLNVYSPIQVTLPRSLSVLEGQSVNLADVINIQNGTQPFEYSWRDAYNRWSSSEQNPAVSPEYSKRYYLTITDANGCTSNEATVYVNVQRQPKAGEIDEELSEVGISYMEVYPNPTTSDLNVNINFSNNSNVEIKITNLLGQDIYSKQLENANIFEGNIDLGNVPAGIYILQISIDGKTTIKKIIKQ